MRKNTAASLVLALALGLPMAACQDTKTLKENETLKAHVAELEKKLQERGEPPAAAP